MNSAEIKDWMMQDATRYILKELKTFQDDATYALRGRDVNDYLRQDGFVLGIEQSIQLIESMAETLEEEENKDV